MDTVGVRELKSGLSRYLKRVQSGARFEGSSSVPQQHA